jgi:hypothetical protein
MLRRRKRRGGAARVGRSFSGFERSRRCAHEKGGSQPRGGKVAPA